MNIKLPYLPGCSLPSVLMALQPNSLLWNKPQSVWMQFWHMLSMEAAPFSKTIRSIYSTHYCVLHVKGVQTRHQRQQKKTLMARSIRARICTLKFQIGFSFWPCGDQRRPCHRRQTISWLKLYRNHSALPAGAAEMEPSMKRELCSTYVRYVCLLLSGGLLINAVCILH